MRIDNHMAGYRPPPPKSLNKAKHGGAVQTSAMDGLLFRSSLSDDESSANGQSYNEGRARQKVHQRSKIEKAAYILATRGAI